MAKGKMIFFYRGKRTGDWVKVANRFSSLKEAGRNVKLGLGSFHIFDQSTKSWGHSYGSGGKFLTRWYNPGENKSLNPKAYAKIVGRGRYRGVWRGGKSKTDKPVNTLGRRPQKKFSSSSPIYDPYSDPYAF